jgi:hypothetical protein
VEQRKGSLIKYLAECGHWVDCYSLEPTPIECADCAARPNLGWQDQESP